MKQIKNRFSLIGFASLLRGADSSKIEISPYRDWRIALIIFFIGLFISLGFNLYILYEVNRDNFSGAPQAVIREVSLSHEGLMKSLRLIETKEEAFGKIKTRIIDMGDPSL